jgi:hypothetical protein
MRYEKAIEYNHEGGDFAMYLGDEGQPDSFELVGFARTYSEAETTLDELVYSLLSREYAQPEQPVA